MLDIFHNKFYKWEYMEFSKLDRHIKGTFKETFMIKKIYMGIPNGYINQRLANLVINEQVLIWDKKNIFHYKSMYLT